MALKDVIGQEKAINILKGCINKNRVPHAIFFAGDEGIGKKLAAVNFAKALNCTGTSGDKDLFAFGGEKETAAEETAFRDACDKCPSCVKIDKGSHPDVFTLIPEGDGGQITVAAVRQVEEALSYKPFEGEWKIAIIDNADRLNRSAANAFLKCLEEPTQKSILILISSRPDTMLATIRSRCQRVNFTPLPIDTMSSLIREKYAEFDDEEALLLSTLSGGRLGYALNENLVAQRDWSFDIFMQMLGSPEDNIWEDRNAMEDWFEWGQLLLRDIAAFKATGRADLLINRDKKEAIEKIASVSHLKDILKLSREFYTIKERLHFNLNKQLTFNYTSLLLKEMLGKKDH